MPRVTDLYAALPSITGKFELEYEGELRGAEQVARDLIRSAVGTVFTGMFDGVDTRSRRRMVRPRRLAAAERRHARPTTSSRRRSGVQGLRELAERTGVPPGASAPAVASAIDFVLEGLCAQQKISRSDERGYAAGTERRRAGPRAAKKQPMDEEIRIPGGGKKKYYN